MAKIKYALFGATGSVGKALAAKLAERGQSFRVVGRSEERLRQDFKVFEPLVEYGAADLSDSSAGDPSNRCLSVMRPVLRKADYSSRCQWTILDCIESN